MLILSAIVTLTLVVAAVIRWRTSRLPVPLFAFFAVYVYLEFSAGALLRSAELVPYFATQDYAARFDTHEIDRGAFLGTCGLAIASISYIGCSFALRGANLVPSGFRRAVLAANRFLEVRSPRVDSGVAASLSLLALLGAARVIPGLNGHMLFGALTQGAVIAVSVTAVFRGTLIGRLVGIPLLGWAAISALATSLLYSVLKVVWPLYLSLCVRRGWLLMMCVLAALSPLVLMANLYKDVYRRETWYWSSSGSQAIESTLTTSEASFESAFVKTFHRHDYSEMLGRSESYAGALGPESMAFVVYGFVPRFLWPNKPLRDEGNRVGRMLGVLDQDDYTTSQNVHGFVEGMLALGVTGLVVVAVGYGVVWYLFERLAALPRSPAGRAAIGSSVGYFWVCESGFSNWIVISVASLLAYLALGVVLSAIAVPRNGRRASREVSGQAERLAITTHIDVAKARGAT